MAAVTVGTGALAGRLAEVRDRISTAGADPGEVEVVAVTKGFGPDTCRLAAGAGLALGENYAQEVLAKAPEVGAGARWHYLGAVQRNKVGSLAPLVELWHSIDRAEVIDSLARRRPGAAALIEVELTGLPGRHGAAAGQVAGLVSRGRDAGLDVRGLMTVAPPGGGPAARRCFADLAALAGRLGLRQLSMGMSDDFELAVAEGATTVRLGRALFGPRPGPRQAQR